MGYLNNFIFMILAVALSTFAHADNYTDVKNNKRAAEVYNYVAKTFEEKGYKEITFEGISQSYVKLDDTYRVIIKSTNLVEVGDNTKIEESCMLAIVKDTKGKLSLDSWSDVYCKPATVFD